MSQSQRHERRPLLRHITEEVADNREVRLRYVEFASINIECRANDTSTQVLYLDDNDPENPRAWPRRKKLANVAVIALMAGDYFLLPTSVVHTIECYV